MAAGEARLQSIPSEDAEHRQRWTIAALLSVGVLVNYFDRVNLSVSHDALYHAFHISDFMFGLLLGAYNWTYAACQLPSGVLLDKFGVRRVGLVSTFLWSVASFGAAATPGIGGFFAARFLLGVGEAPSFPGSAKAVGYWFPPRERSFATAWFDGAAKFGSAIGVPIIGLLLLRIGWRLSFAATGVLSLLYLFLFWAIYRDPVRKWSDEGITATRSLPGRRASLGYLLRRRKVIGLAIGFGSYNYVFYLLLTWLPVYLERSLHIDLARSFIYTGIPWFVATITELLVGGWLVDALVRRGWNASSVRRTVLMVGTSMGLGLLGALGVHTAGRAVFWISFSLGGLCAASPVGWSIPSLIAPGDSVGSVGGIMNFSNQISGIAAPALTGYLVGVRHNFKAAFLVAAVYLVIGVASYAFLLGEIRPIPEPAE